jgi:hypothetical protein
VPMQAARAITLAPKVRIRDMVIYLQFSPVAPIAAPAHAKDRRLQGRDTSGPIWLNG